MAQSEQKEEQCTPNNDHSDERQEEKNQLYSCQYCKHVYTDREMLGQEKK